MRSERLGWVAVLAMACSETPDAQLLEGDRDAGSGPPDIVTDAGPPDAAAPDADSPALPQVEVLDAPLDFGRVLVGGSAEGEVRVVNTGEVDATVDVQLTSNVAPCRQSAPVPFCWIDDDLDGQEFALAPGATRALRFRYDAGGAVRQATGTVTLQTCPDDVACELSFELNAETIRDALVCDPTALDFGFVNPDTCLERSIRCENVASAAIVVEQVSLRPGSDPSYSFPAMLDPRPLAPEESFAFEVAVCGDRETDDKTGVVQLEYSAGDLGGATDVGLVATLGGADIRIDRTSIDYGDCSLITPCTEVLLITNVGDRPLSVQTSATSTTGQVSFSVTDVADLQPGGSQIVEIVADVNAVGAFGGTLRLQSNDPDSPVLQVGLTGVGIEVDSCPLEIDRTIVRFGPVELHRTVSLDLGLRNPGSGTCLVRGFRLVPLALSATNRIFELDGPRSFLLGPGERRGVRITAAANDRLGARAENLVFEVSDLIQPNRLVAVTAELTTSRSPVLARRVDFGEVPSGCSTATRTITMTNARETAVTWSDLDEVVPVTNDRGLFTRDRPSLPQVLQPGDSSSFEVAYVPESTTSVQTVEVVVEGDRFPISLVGARGGTQVDEFVQLERSAADVLFVIDTSPSNTDDQEALGQSLDTWMNRARGLGVDVRYAVTTMDLSRENGRLVPLDRTRPQVVDLNTMPSPEAVLAANITLGDNGSGNEQPFEGAFRAFDPQLLSTTNAGWLRPEASLGIFVLIDEAGSFDFELPTYLNYFYAIKGFAHREAFSLSGMTGGPTGCSGIPGGTAAAAPFIDAAIIATGGAFHPVCDFDPYPLELRERVLGVRNSFPLRSLAEPSTVEVRLNGTIVASTEWTYVEAANSIRFDTIPNPGDAIQVRYQSRCGGP